MIFVFVLIAAIIASEIALRCPWAQKIDLFRKNASKSIRVLQSGDISDHFKNRVLPAYSLRSLEACGQLLFFLILIAVPFLLPAVFDYFMGSRVLWSTAAAFEIVAVSVCYTAVRLYLRK